MLPLEDSRSLEGISGVRRKRILSRLGIVFVVLVLIYACVFCGLRKRVSVARGLPLSSTVYLGCNKRLSVFYFSENKHVNEACYVVFIPIHRWVLSGHTEDAALRHLKCNLRLQII